MGQLPYVFRLAPSLSLAGSGNVKLPPDDVLKVEHVGHYPFLAGDFAHFLRGTTLGSSCTCDPAAGMPSLPRWDAACHAAITGTQAVLQQSAGSQEAGQIAPATLPITGRWSAVHPLNADLSSC